VQSVASVQRACDLVDELPFALTGGLFARDPATVRYVRERTPVGNLYVNRGITGAMVARQPFGGNRLSGTGTKAGGPDYLLQFVEPRAVTENTMRHGLVV
jgi:RHH-type proline utilization regulon transcriptional repressor/proline dehydrogenase/delta 1-pyrroline-5-carboxylate dehydrogenase